MRRAGLTMVAVLFIFGGVAGSVASVSEARSRSEHATVTRGDDGGKHKRCDDDRRHHSTPKACDRDDHDRHNDHGDDD